MPRFLTRSLAILFLCLVLPLQAELLNSDLGFFLDLPEGYSLASPIADGRFDFIDPTGQARFQLWAYEGSRYASAQGMREEADKKLSAKGDGGGFSFQGREAYLGERSFSAGGASYRGYIFCLNGRGGERDFLILSYVAAPAFSDYKDFLLSAIDSFSLDSAGLRLPGPVSWHDYPFDAEPTQELSLSFGGAQLKLSVPENWSKGAQALIEREFSVLGSYQGVEDLWQGAWKRYYRMAYRDSYHRLDRLSFLMGLQIESQERLKAVPGKEKSADSGVSAAGSGVSAELYASALLSWVQGFKYTRDLASSDLLNPLDSALKADGDCDGRALLMAIILHHWNIDAAMAVSRTYSHALALVDIPAKPGRNAGIEADGKRYLVGETTAKVGLGLIAEDQADPAEWIGIGFGF